MLCINHGLWSYCRGLNVTPLQACVHVHVCLYICAHSNDSANWNVGMFPCSKVYAWGSSYKGSGLCWTEMRLHQLKVRGHTDIELHSPYWPPAIWKRGGRMRERMGRKTIMPSTEVVQHLTWDQISSDNTEPDLRLTILIYISSSGQKWDSQVFL